MLRPHSAENKEEGWTQIVAEDGPSVGPSIDPATPDRQQHGDRNRFPQTTDYSVAGNSPELRRRWTVKVALFEEGRREYEETMEVLLAKLPLAMAFLTVHCVPLRAPASSRARSFSEVVKASLTVVVLIETAGSSVRVLS